LPPLAVPDASAVRPLSTAELNPLLILAFVMAVMYLVVRPRPLALKTEKDLQAMRHAGKLAARVLEHLSPLVTPNVTTGALDEAASNFTVSLGCLSAPLNYGGLLMPFLATQELGKAVCVLISHMWWYASTVLPLPQQLPSFCGFPRSVCISVNDEVAHGVPDATRFLRLDDLVNIDVTVITRDGWHGDTSMMWQVGRPPLDDESGSDKGAVTATTTADARSPQPRRRRSRPASTTAWPPGRGVQRPMN
jgi:methionine aminopeptidase